MLKTYFLRLNTKMIENKNHNKNRLLRFFLMPGIYNLLCFLKIIQKKLNKVINLTLDNDINSSKINDWRHMAANVRNYSLNIPSKVYEINAIK